jgi:hypothetical protein
METFNDFDEYQVLALRTASPTSTATELAMLTECCARTLWRVGRDRRSRQEIVYHGHPLDDDTRDKIAKEIGDILWYCAMGSRGDRDRSR